MKRLGMGLVGPVFIVNGGIKLGQCGGVKVGQ